MNQESSGTVRQQLVEALTGAPMSAKGASALLGVSEKDVIDHLKHIEKTAKRADWRLRIMPAECRKCGFVFEDRGKFSKPGKCPECRDTYIAEPAFWIEERP